MTSFLYQADRTLLGMRMQRWELVAKSVLPEMLRSKHSTLKYLVNASTPLREVALEVLLYFWHAQNDTEFATTCQQIVSNDDDVAVRQLATIALGSCYQSTDNVEVGVLLARIVQNDAEPESVRLGAYTSLSQIRHGSHSSICLHNIDSLDQVDWTFVAQSLNQTRSPVPIEYLHHIDKIIRSLPVKQAAAYRQHFCARQSFRHGAYSEAITGFSEALRIWPESTVSLVARARAYLELSQIDDAIADLTSAIRLNPELTPAYVLRARGYRMQGASELAQRDEDSARQLIERAKG